MPQNFIMGVISIIIFSYWYNHSQIICRHSENINGGQPICNKLSMIMSFHTLIHNKLTQTLQKYHNHLRTNRLYTVIILLK